MNSEGPLKTVKGDSGCDSLENSPFGPKNIRKTLERSPKKIRLNLEEITANKENNQQNFMIRDRLS
jgi:hypothetical protein